MDGNQPANISGIQPSGGKNVANPATNRKSTVPSVDTQNVNSNEAQTSRNCDDVALFILRTLQMEHCFLQLLDGPELTSPTSYVRSS
ncbi:hypothetical protein Dda_6616 [Drechslerella dactyloides]|uniref:Uncharacterized protein n=1 Tax=Drechslerella dactyloides TaxID=74499 RepID=A0AAD6IVW8_DREDA|nr:hypothetical protein Dda_6616 [Drechslerella dactyloides]